MNERPAPPLKIVLAAFLAVVLLQFPADLIITHVSVAWGVLANEFLFMGVFPVAIIRLMGYDPWALVSFRRSGGARVLVAVCLTIGAALLLSYLKNFSSQIVPIPGPIFGRHADVMIATSWNDFFLKLVLLAGIAPFCEEVLFRGLIQTALMRKYGNAVAILTTAVLFALIHSTDFQPHLYLLLGLIFSWIYSVTRSLRVTIICHAINNAWVLANKIQGFDFPLQEPMGAIDAVLIASGAVMLVASVLWLWKMKPAR